MKPTDFAVTADIDQSQYSKIENGKLKLSDNIWDKLDKAYNLDKPFILLGINVPRGTFNSTVLVPGPEASLVQLVKADRELRIALQKIRKQIDDLTSGEKDNLTGENQSNQQNKDNESKKDRSDKE